jgi:hypothetical protein
MVKMRNLALPAAPKKKFKGKDPSGGGLSAARSVFAYPKPSTPCGKQKKVEKICENNKNLHKIKTHHLSILTL